ncbi:arsenic resistance protein ArsD [Halogeometricum pallidum JCM 14848]|jgi:hypothetical protein|uniref:Arsenic resistance protein ArsD n=1 Tax=Halogeometricum pallidum JCM 14848 TaxID=1227487 RepID=M0D2N2_HALPD|nr:arsenite efflux transporter metallochaperone ArsD [Halogeometricum pallidum]ELZ29083.1 arsenic resistance protein ArsD [Halogeometricum pallidum JCM 14848]
MIEVTIFESAMCCSTGVCGPDPDEELVAITRAVDKLDEEYDDVEVTRASLSQNIDAFLEHQEIYDTVQSEGPSILPITVVDDDVIAKGEYPSYEMLSETVESNSPTKVQR